MTPEDLQEMSRHHHQEALLHAHGFEPLLPDGHELWVRTGPEHPELFTRGACASRGAPGLRRRERGVS